MDIAELLGIDPNDPEYILSGRLVRQDEKLLDDLVRLRRTNRLSQEAVGQLMGVGQSAVARIESGERDPRLSTLRRYALAVGADVEHTVAPFDAKLVRRARTEPAYAAETKSWSQSFEQSSAFVGVRRS